VTGPHGPSVAFGQAATCTPKTERNLPLRRLVIAAFCAAACLLVPAIYTTTVSAQSGLVIAANAGTTNKAAHDYH
jgi:hypothetical protein